MQTDSVFSPQRAAIAAPPPRRGLVLVVDDDIELASMSAMALGTQGWHTIVAHDPLAAAAIAHDLPIDVLVTDLEMPGMSGIELADVVRVHHANLPVILVSGACLVEPPPVESPFTFLAKPFRLQALFDVITALAGRGDDATNQMASQRRRETC
jgi:two-component system NtrC family sensor kinase